MDLLTSSWLAENLCCPSCRSRVAPDSGLFRCANAACGKTFPTVHGQPVLIDFGASVVDEEDVRRTSGWMDQSPPNAIHSAIRRVLWGRNPVADTNARRLLDATRSSESPKVLIVGGGAVGSGSDYLYRAPGIDTITFDIYASQKTQFVADAHQIPLRDSCVDAVWIQAVLEHVVDPWQVVAEIRRVLKPKGLVYSDTPFMQQVHGAAWDFTRFTESGHRWLFRDFERIDSGVVAGAGSALVSSIRYAAWGVARSQKVGALAAAAFSWLRLLDHLVPADFARDSASSFYFLGRKSEQSLGPREIIRYYHARAN